MAKEHYFNLQHSESVIANMASRIFAAYVRSGEVNQANEEAFVKRAVDVAIKLAAYTDEVVKSDGEFMQQESGSSATLL